MKQKLTANILSMQLNADNRRRLEAAILNDTMKGRSDKVRKELIKLMEKIRLRTFGATPQARAANMKLMAKYAELTKLLRDKGIYVRSGTTGDTDNDLSVNMAGRSVRLYWKKSISDTPVISMTSEFLSSTCTDDNSLNSVKFGATGLTLKADDPLADQFWKLNSEAESIASAGEELRLSIRPMLKARTLKLAVEKWPELEAYVSSILSASREITVRPEVLTARIKALKSGKGSAAEAIKTDA